ncbi:MAG: RNA methyltransferase [Simkaniaceae bacterium]|nr:RNA methyltransferase [Simkaniaceae bacterium]MCF7853027.1 RNA methyltransferase [Simkaniaceae bacterium]
MQKIDSLDDERLIPYLSLKAQQETFIAEGIKVVTSLFQSDLEIISIVILENYIPFIPEKHHHRVLIGNEQIMQAIIGYKMHQGIMALAKIPPMRDLKLLQGPAIFLQGLANAENVGAIIRSAAAFGIEEIIFDSMCSPPYLRRTVKTSMGAIFKMKVYHANHSIQDLGKFKQTGYQIIGADPQVGNVSVSDFKPMRDWILVLGSEGHGIDQGVKALCDPLVRIPICSEIDSLNVAAASAIFLYILKLAG